MILVINTIAQRQADESMLKRFDGHEPSDIDYSSRKLKLIVISLTVLSRIDYNNCIYVGLSDYSLDCNQFVMNAAARVISLRGTYDHVVLHILHDLH